MRHARPRRATAQAPIPSAGSRNYPERGNGLGSYMRWHAGGLAVPRTDSGLLQDSDQTIVSTSTMAFPMQLRPNPEDLQTKLQFGRAARVRTRTQHGWRGESAKNPGGTYFKNCDFFFRPLLCFYPCQMAGGDVISVLLFFRVRAMGLALASRWPRGGRSRCEGAGGVAARGSNS